MSFIDLPAGKQVLVGAKHDSNFDGVDAATNTLQTIEYEHHEVHRGRSFHCSDVINVNDGTQQWMLTTPNLDLWMHMIFNIECTGEMLVIIEEAGDRVGTTILDCINHNRNCTATSEMIVHRAITGGTTDGNTIYTVQVGATGVGNRTVSPGAGRAINEWVLRQNTKYLISVTTSADVVVSLEIDWYEHADKNDAFIISMSPSLSLSLSPSLSPSISPSLSPSISESLSPSISPSVSYSPSLSPSFSPSLSPSISPSISPSVSSSPSISPSFSRSLSPSISLSISPSISPSLSPSLSPSFSLSLSPSISPSLSPSLSPSISPSA